MTISVVIPNYNREQYIGATLESILSQTKVPEEIIVIDDGSTDASEDVVRSYEPHVRLIKQSNQGPGAARNHGLKLATGEFIQFFDSDDLLTENKLETQAKALTSSGADMAYGPWAKVAINHSVIKFHETVIQQGALPTTHKPLTWFLRGWVSVFQACLFRTAMIRQVGGYREDLMPTEDSELLFRILSSGAKLLHVPDSLVLYRVHDGGQITTTGTSAFYRANDWVKYLDVVDKQIADQRLEFDWLTRLHWASRLWQAQRDYSHLCPVGGQDVALRRQYSFPESAALWSLDFLQRVQAGLRSRCGGTRYQRQYRAAVSTERQLRLIDKLGYSVANQ